MHQELLILF